MLETLDRFVLLSAAGLIALALYAILHHLAVDDGSIRATALLGAICVILAMPVERR